MDRKKRFIRYLKRVFYPTISGCIAFFLVKGINFILNNLEPGWLVIFLMPIAQVILPLYVAFRSFCIRMYKEAEEDGDLEEILKNTPPLFKRRTKISSPTYSEIHGINPKEPFTTVDQQELHRNYTAIDYLRTKVVGVTFDNDITGINRQHLLFLCKAGDPVSLKFYRYKGSPAYAVMTRYGQIGNLSASFADTIYNRYGQYVLVPEIKEITGGKEGYPYGCVLQIAVYHK